MKKLALFLLSVFAFYACGEDIPPIGDYGETNYTLLTQDSSTVQFPDLIKGNVTVVGYIFTNCPDICPLTTNNMRMVRDRLMEEDISGVRFVSISFDPEADKPSVLKKYAEIRNLDSQDWTFLTGDSKTISSLMNQAGIVAVPSDSTLLPSGEYVKYFVHTDRISLVGEDGKIRKNYKGSQADIDEIVEDIKTLKD